MANITINALPPVTSLNGTEQFPLDQTSVTLQTTLNAMGNFILNSANTVSTSGNITSGAAISGVSLIASGNVTAAAVAANTITTGNLVATNISGNIANATGGYGNTNVNMLLGNLGVDIIPNGNNVTSLGNATNQFKDLYLSNATLYFDSVPMTVAGTTLQVNGENVVTTSSGNTTTQGNINVTGNVTAENIIGNVAVANVVGLGNIATVNLNNNSAQYLAGNGAWVTPAVPTTIVNGTSNVNVPAANGNITMSVANASAFNLGTTTVAIGTGSGITTQNANAIAIGLSAGNTNQGTNGIAIGYAAGNSGQGGQAIAIGRLAATTNQGARAIAIGELAVGSSVQQANAVSIGWSAAQNGQGQNAVAIGYMAAQSALQGFQGIAIGSYAGRQSQGANAVAIGSNAAVTIQGTQSVAVGMLAGSANQGNNAVALGASAGQVSQGNSAIAIGYLAGNASQPATSIIINASGTALNGTNAGLYVKPVRNDTGNTSVGVFYNTSTSELTYANVATPPASTIAAANTKVQLNNITAQIGGTPTRLYMGTVTGNMTVAGQTQTMLSGSTATSSWINVPLQSGVGNEFAVGGAISQNGELTVFNFTDQDAGTGSWRVTAIIANTASNLYSITIEKLA